MKNNSNLIVACLNINSLGEKINHIREICKEPPIDILCVDGTKLGSSNQPPPPSSLLPPTKSGPAGPWPPDFF